MRVGYRELCDALGITLTPEQEAACAFLELHGLRFCVDYGHDNCIELAAAERAPLATKVTVH